MVIRILNLPDNPGEDAADALGIALCAGYSKDGMGADARFRLSTRSRAGGRKVENVLHDAERRTKSL